MHRKRAHFLFMHSTEARPKALHECTKRKCAQTGASSLTCCSCMKCLVVFLWTSLLALMLNSNTVEGGIGLQTAFCHPHRHSVHRPMSSFQKRHLPPKRICQIIPHSPVTPETTEKLEVPHFFLGWRSDPGTSDSSNRNATKKCRFPWMISAIMRSFHTTQ